jgi:hypothetical protein
LTVIEDYKFLIDQRLHQEGQLETINYSKLTYELGEAYRRIGRNEDAARCWTNLEQETQEPEFRQLLRQKLQSLEGKPAIEHILANDSTTSILIGRATRAVGNVLLKWVEEEPEKEAPRKSQEETKKEAPRKRHEEKKKKLPVSIRREDEKRSSRKSHKNKRRH